MPERHRIAQASPFSLGNRSASERSPLAPQRQQSRDRRGGRAGHRAEITCIVEGPSGATETAPMLSVLGNPSMSEVVAEET